MSVICGSLGGRSHHRLNPPSDAAALKPSSNPAQTQEARSEAGFSRGAERGALPGRERGLCCGPHRRGQDLNLAASIVHVVIAGGLFLDDKSAGADKGHVDAKVLAGLPSRAAAPVQTGSRTDPVQNWLSVQIPYKRTLPYGSRTNWLSRTDLVQTGCSVRIRTSWLYKATG